MNVAHVIASLGGAGIGPAYAVSRLTSSLSELHVGVEVQTLMPVPEQTDDCVVGYRLSPVLRRLGISPDMRRGLGAVAADILHNNGVWMMPNVYAGTVARKRGLPLVFSPHGMFSEWAMASSRWRKWVAWRCLGQRRAAAATTCFHATSISEAQDIRRLGFRQPIAVVPHGIDPPDLGGTEAPANCERRRTMLFLSRIHPKKGIRTLLSAWRRLERRFPAWDLVIAGPDEGDHLSQVQKLGRDLDLKRVFFPGPAYGDGKRTLYRRADVFVLPTHSENFGMAIAEALSFGVPVITTTGAPWRELEGRGCGWWIELSDQNLAAALAAAMNLPEAQRREMGRRGRLWMEESFGWSGIAAEMKAVYQWVLGGGPPPSCVLTV